jgi:8-oxo-dGTP pyrophosphatase MutT (NUDIX family)
VREEIKQALSRRQSKSITMHKRVKSAVILPIYYKEGQYYILFIKRTEKVKVHKGQISFPGGTYEERDGTLLNTALRESAEEVGLAPADVEILGMLDDTPTVTSNYVITPFVAFIPSPYQLKADSEEIEEIIEVPVSALLQEGCMEKETEFEGGEWVTSYTYSYKGRIIWGATARILKQFLGIWKEIKREVA